MKNVFRLSGLILLILSIFLIHSCKKEAVPTLTTSEIINITGTTATSGGTITDEGSGTIISRGVCWSTAITPTIKDNKTTDGAGAGTFISNLTGLSAGTTYYVRAYATNSAGTGYGSAMSFETEKILTDIEGNIYKTVIIGTQYWMQENLRTTKYNDGTAIPLVTDKNEWQVLSSPAFCWYNNDPTPNKADYGALYNWYTVNTGNLCPVGWHVPSSAEWTKLTTFLGGENVAGDKMKETGVTHWLCPDPYNSATNESRFSAYAGGYRITNGLFAGFGTVGCYWSSSVHNTNLTDSWYFFLACIYHSGTNQLDGKTTGSSVRCIKDN